MFDFVFKKFFVFLRFIYYDLTYLLVKSIIEFFKGELPFGISPEV